MSDVLGRWSARELTPWQQQRRRSELAEWRSQRWQVLGNTARTCQRPIGPHVTVHVDRSGVTSVKGIRRCGSVWGCPWCAPKVRAQRAEDIAAAVEAAHAVGIEVWLITATLPHRQGDQLMDLRKRIQGWWTDAWGGKAGKALRDRCGVVGTIRVVEVTHGRNGWHPHIHALWFIDPSAGAGGMDVAAVAARWRSRFDAEGIGDKFVPRVSIDVRRVRPGERARSDVGQYLGKVRQVWGVGAELARQDLKTRGGLHPPELLELAACGEAKYVRLWMEFERGTKGWQAIRWSNGLRSLAIGWQADAVLRGVELRHNALDTTEKTDEEAAAGDDVSDIVASAIISAGTWNYWKRQGRIAELLQLIVRGEPPPGVWIIRSWVDLDRPPDDWINASRDRARRARAERVEPCGPPLPAAPRCVPVRG